LKNLASKVSAATEIRDANLPAVKFQAIIDADQGVLGGQESPAAAAAAVQQVFDANPTVK
jgi:hypothetical protein